jgi:hypothetical protein
MSRSYKKAIYKDKGWIKNIYWRIIRRVQKQCLKQGKDIPNPKQIIEDCDYHDYVCDYEYKQPMTQNGLNFKTRIKRK